MHPDERKPLIEVARGLRAPERVLYGGQIVNTRSREIYPADILIYQRRIAAVLPPSPPATWTDDETIDAIDVSGMFVSPGFIDPHVHIESSMVTVSEYASAVIPRGTTTIAADPHEIGNVLGERGMKLMVDEARTTPLRMLLRVPGKIPAMPDELETSNGRLTIDDTKGLFAWPEAVCLAGDINPALTVTGDADHLAKVHMVEQMGRTVAGQSPGLTGRALSAYVAGGPEDSHVAKTADEVIENLRTGLRSILAYRPRRALGDAQFADLAKRVRENGLDTRTFQFCTDDIHAHFLHTQGSLDFRLRRAIKAGFPPVMVYQMATLNVAEGLRIDRDFGSITPGRHADLVVLQNLEEVDIDRVLVGGEVMADRNGMLPEKRPVHAPYPEWATKTMNLKQPICPADLQVRVDPSYGSHARIKAITMSYPKKDLHVELPTEVVDGQDALVVIPDPSQNVLCFSVADRHKASGRIGRGFIHGFGLQRGAIATSISHDAHQLLTVGANHDDMALAANRLAEIGGGYAVALDGEVIFDLPLPVAGLMSEKPLAEVANTMAKLEQVVEARLGCVGSNGVLKELNFTCLPNIPFFGFTDYGLIDSHALKRVDVLVADEVSANA